MDFAVLGTAFGMIFLAELPDKTALASLVLGTRYRAGAVFAGVAAAFTVHVVLAIVAGSLLGLLPHRVVAVIAAVLFGAGAVAMLRRREDHGPGHVAGSRRGHETGDGPDGERARRPPFKTPRALTAATTRDGLWRVAATSFAVLFIAEFGDLSQIAIANLAARYHEPVPVGIGAAAGLWAVGGLAIFGGRQLLRLLPLAWINRAAATVMATLALFSLLAAIGG